MLIAWHHHCHSSLAVASDDGEVVDEKTPTCTMSTWAEGDVMEGLGRDEREEREKVASKRGLSLYKCNLFLTRERSNYGGICLRVPNYFQLVSGDLAGGIEEGRKSFGCCSSWSGGSMCYRFWCENARFNSKVQWCRLWLLNTGP
jgi:hypothetical protein